MRTLIAGDWHLGTYSPPAHVRLAAEFLRRARRDGDRVVLNGDIFEGIFEPVSRAESAQAGLTREVAELTSRGQLVRTEGNHDPGAGVLSVVLEHRRLGAVLVAHGHLVDPMHGSHVGEFGDGISRRFGHLAVVRGAARMVEVLVAVTVAAQVDRAFRVRCLGMVERHGCAVGVFGHNHRAHLASGDAYVNAGSLHGSRLEYVVLDDLGVTAQRLELVDLEGSAPAGGGSR